MPALAPVTPDAFRRILELHGYHIVQDDEYNWVLARDSKDVPIILPKKGSLVALDVMMDALDRAKMDNGTFFALKAEAQGKAASGNPN